MSDEPKSPVASKVMSVFVVEMPTEGRLSILVGESHEKAVGVALTPEAAAKHAHAVLALVAKMTAAQRTVS